MRIQIAWSVVTLGLLQSTSTKAFTSSHAPKSTVTIRHSSLLSVTAAQPDIVEVTTDEAEHDNHHTPRELTLQIISSLPFRGLISELASRGQSTDGTTARLRRRLRQVALPDLEDECIVIEDDVGDECVTSVRSA